MHTDLWNHALALYARPGVEAACLALQERGGDVCLLLCATWLQARGVAADEQRVLALQALAGPWQREVIVPLRTLRKQWRQQASGDRQLNALRERVKDLELQSERTLLERLQSLAGDWASGTSEGEDWLARLAPDQAQDHDALHLLRVAAQRLQEAEDGV
ncbi:MULTISPECIES: TIGR02444 family protein [unclassified Pseudomonas]|uniref:TIGR02444 family protein n=1 Tax=unclassified Pseudomonas TaxID=196821 RepID=UPI002446CF7F|nr:MULTISPECIES: TIGR02444 family protein [unclassified Pseudomonas]MDH0302554.1 TIGR02444 family protein [Pseudomonas sp. GD04091]MDH1983727.1 TIGR02444 family protein [Pseudomonas sp. GD03689]